MKKVITSFAVLFILMGLGLNAQSGSLKAYVGEYACISHGTASLSLKQSGDAFSMAFCKDVITNDCETHQLHPSLGSESQILGKSGSAGAPIKTLNVTVSHSAKQPIIAITTADGTEMEFLRKE